MKKTIRFLFLTSIFSTQLSLEAFSMIQEEGSKGPAQRLADTERLEDLATEYAERSESNEWKGVSKTREQREDDDFVKRNPSLLPPKT